MFPKNLENYTELIWPLMALNNMTKSNSTFLEQNLNPTFRNKTAATTKSIIQKFKDIYNRIDRVVSFPTLVATLWYASLPCFDVQGLTSDYDGQRSILKQCKWKGVQIPCSSIFTTYPTDKGMCCAFNMKGAGEIFHEKIYSTLIQTLQAGNLVLKTF